MSRESSRFGLKWYVSGISLVAIVAILFINSDCDSTSSGAIKDTVHNSSPEIPDTLSFCGETIPLNYFDVREALERELLVNTFYHSQTILLIKKANRYFPTIEPILKENNIPDDFKYLAVAESGLANVVSPSNAVGFWQLLEGTAKDYGLEINTEVDERYHLQKSTMAACEYLKESYAKYTSWTLSAASYNVGRKGVDRQIDRQNETEYFDLLFNEETARYVYRILALKIVLENPERYNFYIEKGDLYRPIASKEVVINSPIESWADFAKEHNTNYKILKFMNPWLRDKKLTNKTNKEYNILVPRKNARNI